MADDLTYSFKSYPTTTKTEEIRFYVWGGRLRVGVRKTESRETICEFIISGEKKRLVRQTIEQILKASPGQARPIHLKKWNVEKKEWTIVAVLQFVKDPTNVYKIQMKYNGTTYESNVRGPADVDLGSEPMSNAQRSTIGLESLLDYLVETVPYQEVLTNKKREFPGGGNSAPSIPRTVVNDDNGELF